MLNIQLYKVIKIYLSRYGIYCIMIYICAEDMFADRCPSPSEK